jgi:MFS transporter, ACS family, tartrate transporter
MGLKKSGHCTPADQGEGNVQGTVILSAQAAESAVRKVQFRILPFILILYIVSVLDRVNIGFAALTMNKELAIGAQQFGFLTGIFFIGYLVFEVPSNLIMHKVGARIWMARILITWGIIAACTGLAHTALHLYMLRFLLGVAEAGFFPGMILYLTYWFRARERAQAVALFMVAVPLASVIGAPVSGVILDHIHWWGLASWRWLLILEGLPPVLLGALTFFVLPNRPSDARFLTAEEKEWLAAELVREEQATLTQQGHLSAIGALGNGRVWYLAIIYFAMMIGLNVMNFWMPQVVRDLSSRYSNTVVGLLVMIPHVCGLVAMILISRHSDARQERRFHAAIPAVLGGVALLFIGKVASPVVAVLLLSLMGIGIEGFFGPFWSLPSRYLTGFAAASGIALINSVGNLGGFAGPYLLGVIVKRTGSAQAGFVPVGAAMIVAALLVLGLRERHQE